MARLMRSYAASVSFKTLFAALMAVTLFFAPAITRAGDAFAAVPDHQMQMMDGGRCQMPPAKSGDHGKMDKNCCMAMCMAVAVAPSAPGDVGEPKHATSYFAAPQSWHCYLGEIATPPPRIA